MVFNSNNLENTVGQIKESSKIHQQDCLICIPEDCKIDLIHFIELLNEAEISFVGTIFPSIFNQEDCYTDKILVKFFNFKEDAIYLDQKSIYKPDSIFAEIKRREANSLLMFCDPYTENLSTLLIQLFNTFGDNLGIAGACTSQVTNRFNGNIFNSEGIHKDLSLIHI